MTLAKLYRLDGALPRLPTQDELPYSDGEPLESERHVLAMMLLIVSLRPWLRKQFLERGVGSYVGGNMFLYFSPEQVRNRHFRGPDVLVALGVEPGERKSWVVWQERKAPDIVIELLSDSTRRVDTHEKPAIYRDEVGVKEYFLYDPFNPQDFSGFAFRPDKSVHTPNLKHNAAGRLVSECLGLQLGPWRGTFSEVDATWLRFYTNDGELLLTDEEAAIRRADEQVRMADQQARRADEQARRADEQARRADEQARRADTLARRLRALGIDPDAPEA